MDEKLIIQDVMLLKKKFAEFELQFDTFRDDAYTILDGIVTNIKDIKQEYKMTNARVDRLEARIDNQDVVKSQEEGKL